MIELFPQSVSKTVYEQVTIFCLFPTSCWGKNYKICFRSAQLCTRSTVLALDTRSTVLKFQNNRASKFQKRCSQHPMQIFLEKRENSSKVTKMHPFLTLTNAKSSSFSFFFTKVPISIPSKSLSSHS